MKISDRTQESQFACKIEIDEYVPLRFRSYEDVLGLKHIRLGDFSDSLFEISVDPTSMVLRGFTLTAFKESHELRSIGILPVMNGLPIIETLYNFYGPIGAQYTDIRTQFSVGFGGDVVEIDFGGLCDAQRTIIYANVAFYLGRVNDLVGIRVIGLTPKQVSILDCFRR